MSHQAPRLSVVIATLDGAATLGATLSALHGQKNAPPFEVIVVDDGSVDATSRIAHEMGARVVSLASNHGKGHALNVGVSIARAALVATTDDDCVPPDRWVKEVCEIWSVQPEGVTMIGGSVVPLRTDTFNQRYVAVREPLLPQEAALDERAGWWTRLRYALAPPLPIRIPRSVYFVVGANMSFRRDAFFETTGFIEAPGIAGDEEDIARKLRRRFGPDTVKFFPDLVMWHDFAPSLTDSLRRARTYGRAYGRRWTITGGVPTLKPIPLLLLLVCGLAGLLNGRAAAVLVVAGPAAAYRRWLRGIHEQGPESILYPYVQFVEDLACDVGFLQGLISAIRATPR